MLTMSMACDALKKFDIRYKMHDEDEILDEIVLDEYKSKDAFLHITEWKDDILCTSKYGEIIVKGQTLFNVYKLVDDFCKMITSWENDLNSMIFSDCSIKDLTVRSERVIGSPFFVIDESNHVLTMTSHRQGTVTPEWDYMIKNKRMVVDVVQEIFRNEKFKNHLMQGRNKAFPYTPPGLERGGIDYRIPSPSSNGCMGTLIVVETDNPYLKGILIYTQIFGRAVERWARLHYSETPMSSAGESLKSIIEGEVPTESQKVLFNSLIRPKSDKYVVLGVGSGRNIIFEYYISVFEEQISNAAFCICRDTIFVLTNLENSQNTYEQINTIMKRDVPSIGISNAFKHLDNIKSYAEQAQIALEYGDDSVSMITSKCVMNYIAGEMFSKTNGRVMIHPALLELQDHDNQHNTEYCRTLYVFLKNERSIADSLPVLNIHRNTMIYRLKRINELLDVNLDDFWTREHLLFSFGLI